MELQMHPHSWQRRLPDWPAAVGSGLVGGAVLMVLELLWSTVFNDGSPWRTSHLIAAIAMGPDALQSAGFGLAVVAVALATHYVLGIVFGLILATIVVGFRAETSTGMLEAIGLGFGAGLYFLNFHGMSALFPWIADLRGWPTFIGHLVFGLTVVLTYPLLVRRGKEL